MRYLVVLTSVGSYGDLHPFISLALALRTRGFVPVIAASEAYRQKVAAEGIAFHPVAPAPDQLLQDTGLTEGEILRKLTTRFVIDNAVTPYLERSFQDLREAMHGAGLVVVCNFSMVARLAAQTLALPVVSLLLSPCVFFSAEEPAYLLEAPWLRQFRRLFGPVATKLILDLRRAKARWQTRRITAFRRGLGLAPRQGDELLDGFLQTDRVYGLYSPVLGRLPPDAPPGAVLAGSTFYDGAAEHAVLPADLEAFLAAGTPPLVFTLGSTGVHAPGDFYASAIEVARRLRLRAVLLVGPKAVPGLAHLATHDVFIAAYAPHSLVFPRAAATIHHGGIGTVGQALRAGRVQLVCPMLGDQADNAERLVRLGIARRLDHRHFAVAAAVAALTALLDDPAAVCRAAEIGLAVAAEDGAGVVADDIARLLARSRSAHHAPDDHDAVNPAMPATAM